MKMKRLECFTTHEVASMLGVTPTTVIKWVQLKKIKALHTIGGHRRILKTEIDRIKRIMGFEDDPFVSMYSCIEDYVQAKDALMKKGATEEQALLQLSKTLKS